MGDAGVGVAAAAGAPGLCAAGVFLWARSWRGSPFALNLFKCCLGSCGFLVVAGALAAAGKGGGTGGAGGSPGGGLSGGGGFGDVAPAEVAWLSLSGVLGIVVGDNAWLLSLQILGPRRVVFCDNLKPFLAAAAGHWWLREELSMAPLLAGMFLTAAGVSVISLEKARSESESANKSRRHVAWGWAAAAANVTLDTAGSTLTKIHGVGLTTWEINLIRFGTASIFLLLIAGAGNLTPLAQSWWPLTVGTGGRKREGGERPMLAGGSTGAVVDGYDAASAAATAGDEPGSDEAEAEARAGAGAGAWARLPSMPAKDWGWVVLGVLLTTFLCPALGNFALFLISLPTWATLGALGPMYALPLGWLLRREPVTKWAVLGAALAVAGVIPLALHEHES